MIELQFSSKVLYFLLILSSLISAACTNPVDDLEISSSTTLCPGVFAVNDGSNDGLIKITGSNLNLTCNATTMDGDGTGSAIVISGAQTNVNISGCDIQDYDYSIDSNSGLTGGWITNNTFSDIDYYMYFRATASYIHVHNNTFSGGSASSSVLLYLYYSDYMTVSNNIFNVTGASDNALSVYYGSVGNNITNNTFNMTGGDAGVYVYPHDLTNNNSFWRNTFYYTGFDLTVSFVGGRSALDISRNFYCVDDGTGGGAIGNAYFNGSGYQRPLSDCGPFPNASIVQVVDTWDMTWDWYAKDNAVDLKINNIADATANVRNNGTVEVNSMLNPSSDEIFIRYRDNVTLDCNNQNQINNTNIASGNAIDLRYSNNITIENCSIKNYEYCIVAVGLYNSTIINNTFEGSDDELVYLSTSDYNLIADNRFEDPAGTEELMYMVSSSYNVIANNTFLGGSTDEGLNLYWNAVKSGYNNITNNTFNLTGDDAINLYSDNTKKIHNNSIWRNTFNFRGFTLANSWVGGRTDDRVVDNFFCVDDGTGLGAIGNAYFNGSDYQRPSTDCGPFPNLSVMNVSDTYDNEWVWGGTTSGDDVNISNVRDALANAHFNSTVNVTTAGPFVEEIRIWHRENVTLDCNNIAEINNTHVGSDAAFELYYVNNVTIQNCTIKNYKISIETSQAYNSSIFNNSISDQSQQGIYLSTSNRFNIAHNSFTDGGLNRDMIYLLSTDNCTINNNTFVSGVSAGIELYWTAAGCSFNNITNNTFNITGNDAINLYSDSGKKIHNNSIWRNAFYFRGFTLANSRVGGTTDDRLVDNFFCVDDGTGAIGNAYFNGSGDDRPLTDCGPFPNATTIQVDHTWDNTWDWDAATNGDDLKINNIMDAVANVKSNNTVSVVNAGIYPNQTEAWFRDNVTVDCGSLAVIGNNASTLSGFDVRYTYNFTIQNCTFDEMEYSIYFVTVNNSKVINNSFNNSNDEAIYSFDAHWNLFDGNYFGEIDGSGDEQFYFMTSSYNVINNNTFEANEDDSLYFAWSAIGSAYNNITNNTFNLTSVSYYTIYIYDDSDNHNYSIWRNDFIGEGLLEIGDYDNYFNYSGTGNYWIANDSQAEGCYDLNPVDGRCDAKYDVLNINVYDYFPSTHIWNITGDCGEIIANSTTLTGNVMNATGGNICPQHGLVINNSNVTLDCSNYFINGSDSSLTYGIHIANASNVTVSNCKMGLFTYGVMINGTNSSLLHNAFVNTSSNGGLVLFESPNNTINNSYFYNNSATGIAINTSNNITINSSLICNNTGYGIDVIDSDNLTMNYTTIYNGSVLDFKVNNTLGYNLSLNMTGVVFDSKRGGLENYTNISLSDNINQTSAYSIHWVPRPDPMAFDHPSVRNKSINITNMSSSIVSVDSVTWHWTDNELSAGGHNESFFYVLSHNKTWWKRTPDELMVRNVDSNNIVVSDLVQLYTLGLGEYNSSNVSIVAVDQNILTGSPGGTIQFIINVTNNGALPLNLSVNDTLPSQLTFVAASPNYDSLTAPNIYNWQFELFPPNSQLIYVNATVDAGIVDADTPILNLSNNISTFGWPVVGNNISSTSTDNATIYYANATIIKVNQTSSLPSTGGMVEYNISVENTGATALNVTVNDTLPAGLTFNATSPANTSFTSPRTFGWNFTLAASTTQVIYINGTIDSGAADVSNPVANLTNYVNATCSPFNGDNITIENYSNATAYYTNISLFNVDQPSTQYAPGGIVQFNLTVTNTGNTSLNISMNDTLPAGLIFNATSLANTSFASPRTHGWNITLSEGQSQTVYLNATVNSSVVNSSVTSANLTNIFNATGTPPNGNSFTSENTSNITVYLTNISLLKVDLTASPPTAGGIVQYSINVSNPGTAAIDTVTVVDTLPENLTYSASSPTADTVDGSTITWNNVTSLAADASTLIYLNATVDASAGNGTYTNSVSVTGAPQSGDNVSDSDTAAVGIQTAAITVTKTASNSTPVVGNVINYTLNITNTGTANLTISLNDSMPSNVEFINTTVANTSANGQFLYWDAAFNLSSGNSTSIIYNVTANSTGNGTNIVHVNATPLNGDVVTANDSATIVVSAAPVATTTSSSAPESDPSGTVSWTRICPENMVEITIGGGTSLEDMQVQLALHEPIFEFIGSKDTDEDGKVRFNLLRSGTYRISVRSSRYDFDNPYEFDIDVCSGTPAYIPECLSNEECGGSFTCEDRECVLITGECGYARDHEWHEYVCCSDGDCVDGYECISHSCGEMIIPECVGDDCEDENITDEITPDENTSFEIEYEIEENLSELGISVEIDPVVDLIDENLSEEELPEEELEEPENTASAQVMVNGEPCAHCSIQVTSPSGSVFMINTDEHGSLIVPLDEEGEYSVALLGDDSLLTLFTLNAAAESKSNDSLSIASKDLYSDNNWFWVILPPLLIGLMLSSGLIIYWKMSLDKKKPNKKRKKKSSQ